MRLKTSAARLVPALVHPAVRVERSPIDVASPLGFVVKGPGLVIHRRPTVSGVGLRERVVVDEVRSTALRETRGGRLNAHGLVRRGTLEIARVRRSPRSRRFPRRN
jgi:hypothetical protein